ncbi:Queuine/archaeosine tRNA-ribosyltransferase [Halanaeroarchaeum sp. HSR-CO]|uniref:tRNA guanosine(15) transglycosylase TgtA n=1 Tax=Halanaeroarchaeum sp. HSR-CO TaxID=2866382 RepID=UPI00217D019A|nr:tRNA guanosine(15) transglycosylase TgtA [Halanaeroarchaeum sp. HSR-CO]UWG48860.1 Queuine/archaeosine tRNA-ribosyltransferase [Halanaeroarchaeum sp. HSR-CO]
MRDSFEIRAQDAAGRIGELRVPRADVTVETPTLLPVVNPNLVTIEPERFPAFGVEMLITNSYIIKRDEDLRERALAEGLHDFLGFDGAIMTDSGSFQLAEYGEITTTTAEILEFQHAIGSDVGTPVDLPTPPDVDRDRAESDLATTQERLAIAEDAETGDMLVSAPIQGSTYTDLRERAARHAYETDLDVFPVGAVVPLMNEYRYDDMIDVLAAAKRGLGADAPVHLFGAGHPMMFALAVAMGADLFDSAAYAIYARDDRYLTVSGTEHVEDLEYFPCSCPVCTSHDPAAVREMRAEKRERVLAEHNLWVSMAEIRRVKAAIHEGSLLELVERRARGHPRMVDGYRALLDHTDQLEAADPVSKDVFFSLSAESARRPEVSRHHDRLSRLEPTGDVLLTEGGTHEGFDDSWRVVPPFGPFPRALSQTYPFTAETPERTDRAGYEAAADGVARLAATNPDVSFTLAHEGWPKSALDRVPEAVETVDLDSGDPAHRASEDSNAVDPEERT